MEQQQKEKHLRTNRDGTVVGNSGHDWMHHFERPRFRSPAAGMPRPVATAAAPADGSAAPVRRRSYPAQLSPNADLQFQVRRSSSHVYFPACMRPFPEAAT